MNVIRIIKKRLTTVLRCDAGLAYIEFALSISVLLIMFYGAIEVSRYILIVQRVEKTIDTLTDVLTQITTTSKTVTTTDITNYLSAAPQLMSPYPFNSNGLVILTDLSLATGASTPTVNWQACGGGTLVAASMVAVGGGYLAPPLGFSWNAIPSTYNEEIVVGEIFYQYTPLLTQNIIGPATIYRDAVFTPRFVNVTASSTSCP